MKSALRARIEANSVATSRALALTEVTSTAAQVAAGNRGKSAVHSYTKRINSSLSEGNPGDMLGDACRSAMRSA